MIMSNWKMESRRTGRKLLFLLIFFFTQPVLTASPILQQTDTDSSRVNTQEQYPKRMASRQPWETIVSFPGMLINLPFKIVFKSIGATAGWIYQSKIIDRAVDVLTSDDGNRAVRPTYSSRGGAGLKFSYKNLLSEGSTIKIGTAAGLRSRQKYQLDVQKIKLFRSPIYADISIGYGLLPDEKFYGIGPNSNKGDKSDFSHEQMIIYCGLGAQLTRRMDFSLQVSLEHNNIFNGKDPKTPSITETFLPEDIPGMEIGVRLIGGQIDLNYDSRNVKGAPTSGMELHLGGSIFYQTNRDNYGFYKIFCDFKQYIHLFYGRNLVFRFATELTDPLDNRKIPFYHMAEMGHMETIRGFGRGRFHDLDMILASLEYRYPVLRSRESGLDALIFADGGQVSRDIFTDFQWDNMRYGFGGGIRIWTPEGESLKIMISKSREEWRFYLVLNQ